MKGKKIWKWVGGILLLILLVAGGFAIYINSQWKPILTERIKSTVSESSDSLYTIDFEDVSMNILTGNVSFKNIVFRPDSLVYERMKRAGTAPRHVYRIELNDLILNRVNPDRIYFKKELQMGALVINKPRIQVYFEDNPVKEDTTSQKKTVYQSLSKYLKSVDVEDIVLQDVEFTYIDRSLKVPQSTAVKNMSVRVKDLLIDSASQFDKTRFYYTRDVFVQVKDYKIATKDGMYDVTLGDISASTANRYIRLNDLKMTPRYTDLTFSRKFKTQHDRYDLFFDEILLNGIDFKSLNSTRRLYASSMQISGSKLNVFLNREMPFPTIDKGANFPHVALKRLKLNTIVDTLKIENLNVHYTEYNPKTKARGTVTFLHAKGTILNVTNDSLALRKNNHAKANLSAMFMGKSSMKVFIDFNLTDPNASFTYSGSLAAMNARDMNTVLRPLALVEITSGSVQKATFAAKGNIRGANGWIRFYYKDLKIGVLGQKEDGAKLKKKGLLSLIANALLITDENPSPGEPLRVGYGNFVRPPKSSFFNMMWLCLFDGLKQSVGFTASREKELNASFDKMKGKEDRTKKQIERRQRREERREKREQRREDK